MDTLNQKHEKASSNWLARYQYKLWRRDLPIFLKEQSYRTGAELGVKAGQSFGRCLKANSELQLWGVDNWKVSDSGPYAQNRKHEERARRIAARFGQRAQLIKADILDAAKAFKDGTLDFVFYDLFNYRTSTVDFHRQAIQTWLPKMKQDGALIGRDFHENHLSDALDALGYGWDPLVIRGRESPRLGRAFRKE